MTSRPRNRDTPDARAPTQAMPKPRRSERPGPPRGTPPPQRRSAPSGIVSRRQEAPRGGVLEVSDPRARDPRRDD